ncbi:MAG: hypothetical protein IPK31_20305 [Chitinophagaceae bacterium]|nr:hypothetical protein [Chitinophagaceae bacterium]
MSWFYNLLIGLFGAIIGLLAFADEIAKKIKYLEPVKSLLFKIPFFLLATFFIIWASIQKDSENEDNAKNEKQALEKRIIELDSSYKVEKKKSDSITQKKLQDIVDSSYAKSIKASNEALAKYNLILIDSLQNVASSINLRTAQSQLAVEPVINGVPPIYLIEDGKTVRIKMQSINGTSYNIKINSYFVKILANGKAKILHYEVVPFTDNFLAADRTRTIGFDINSLVRNEELVFIVLLGSFTRDNQGNEKVNYGEAYKFDFKNNKYIGRGAELNLKYFEEYVKKNELDKN